jgi:hypothetical protein
MEAKMINNLDTKEKIILMNTIWESLDTGEDQIESPSWHEEVLKERIKSFENKDANMVSLDVLRSK